MPYDAARAGVQIARACRLLSDQDAAERQLESALETFEHPHGTIVDQPLRPDGPVPAFGEPESAAGLTKEYAHLGTLGRTLHHDLATGASEVEFPWLDHVHTLTESGTELSERNVAHYKLVEGDPLSATVAVEVDVGLARGDWRTSVAVRSEMTCDAERFLVTTSLDAFEGDVRRFARRWTHAIPRDGG